MASARLRTPSTPLADTTFRSAGSGPPIVLPLALELMSTPSSPLPAAVTPSGSRPITLPAMLFPEPDSMRTPSRSKSVIENSRITTPVAAIVRPSAPEPADAPSRRMTGRSTWPGWVPASIDVVSAIVGSSEAGEMVHTPAL